MAKIDNFAGDS